MIGPGSPFFMAAVASGGGVTHRTSQEIAGLAVNPTVVTDFILVGDSRLTAQQEVMIANSPEMIYSGAHGASYNTYTFGSGHTSAQGSPAANAQPTSPYIGGTATWAPQNAWETEFTGSNMSSSDLLTRIFYGGPDLANTFPRIYNRLTGGTIAATARAHVWGGTHGLDGSGDPDVRMWHRPEGVTTTGGTGSLLSSNVSDTSTAGYSEMSIDIPDSYDWATNCSSGNHLAFNTPNSEPTTDDTIFALANMPWIEIDAPGLVVHSWSVGGRSIEGFLPSGSGLSGAAFDSSIWTDYVPLLGDRPKLFWIDLGTNNAASNSQSAHAQKIEDLIEDIRAGTPDASILLTSAFEHSTSGSNPYWRAAAADVAAGDTEGLIYIDTCGLLPTYADGNAAGIYGDFVHYNGTGTGIRAALVSNELAKLAEGLDFASRDWDLEWEWDANVRDSVTMDVGVVDWTDLQDSAKLSQDTDANQPDRELHSSNWGLTTALGFDGSNDVMLVDGSDVSLSELRFLHDGTSDWEITAHVRLLTGIAHGRMIIGTVPTLAGVGLSILYLNTDQMLVRIHNSGGTVIADVRVSVTLDTCQLLRVNFDSSTSTLSLQVDEGTADTEVLTGTPDTGDSAGSLAIGGWTGSSNALCEIGYLAISKTIADSSRQAEQERFFEIQTNRSI